MCHNVFEPSDIKIPATKVYDDMVFFSGQMHVRRRINDGCRAEAEGGGGGGGS